MKFQIFIGISLYFYQSNVINHKNLSKKKSGKKRNINGYCLKHGKESPLICRKHNEQYLCFDCFDEDHPNCQILMRK